MKPHIPFSSPAFSKNELIFLLICLSLSFSSTLPAQSLRDSLKAVLATKNGADRIPVLLKLSQDYFNLQPDQAILYAEEAKKLLEADTDPKLRRAAWYMTNEAYGWAGAYDSMAIKAIRFREFSLEIGDPIGVAEGYYQEGFAKWKKGELEASIPAFQEAEKRFTTLENWEKLGEALWNMGSVYYRQGDTETCLEYDHRALEAFERSGKQVRIAEILSAIGIIYHRVGKMEEARSFNVRALEISDNIGNKAKSANILSEIANLHADAGEVPQAFAALERALKLQEETSDTLGMARTLSNLGIMYYQQGDFDQALEITTRSLQIREKVPNKKALAFTMGNMGLIHSSLGNFSESLQYYARTLAIFEEMGEVGMQAHTLANMGEVHSEWGDFQEALTYFQRALPIWEQMGHKVGHASSLLNIGICLQEAGENSKALEALNQGLALAQEIGHKPLIATILGNMGILQRHMGKLKMSQDLHQQALSLQRELADKNGISEELYRIGLLSFEQKEYSDAIAYTDTALRMAESIGALTMVRDIQESRSIIFEEIGDFKQAFEAHQAFKTVYDSLFTTESNSVIAELQQQYKTKEQQQQIQLLEQDQQIKRQWLIGLVVGLGLLALIIGLVYNRYRLKNQAHQALTEAHGQLKQTQAQLIQSEKLASLGQLTAGIAHEIKNPLNFVNNFAKFSLDLATELEENLGKYWDQLTQEDSELIGEILGDLKRNTTEINQHGQRADSIVRNMMDHASGSRGERQPFDVNQLIQESSHLAYQGFVAVHQGFEAQIKTSLDEALPLAQIVPQDMSRVILNLVNNACEAILQKQKHAPQSYEAVMELSSKHVGQFVEIKLRDNGIGFPADLHDKMFEPFFTTKPTGQGNTGLGLSLSHDIVVQQHQGTMDIRSQEGEWTEVVIHLPLNRS
ncbi:MAG: tetratricopeptide repeat protein [Bacteroidota bacterium]